ncbi:MAG: hypothetical protein MJ228_04745 [Bacilli bacterium]|nr:hypothetical protein [Bacilli bacterium]
MKMTKTLVLMASTLFALASCSKPVSDPTDPSEHSTSVASSEDTASSFSTLDSSSSNISISSEPAEIKDFYTVTVYQSYYVNDRGWGDPRFDCTIEYARGSVLKVDSDFARKIKPKYQVKGDGYYHIERLCFDPERTQEVPRGYQVYSDVTVYYGCTG